MDKYFIAGTGTEVGKTFVTAAICHQLIEERKQILALKPVISGWKYNPNEEDQDNDTVNILQSLKLPVNESNIEQISPWRFNEPAAPNVAAAKENRQILLDKVIQFCNSYLSYKGLDYLLIEGAGGIMSPLTNQQTNLDLAKALGHPIILVASNYCGAITHTLTAIQAIERSGLEIKLIVFNQTKGTGTDQKESIKNLKNFTRLPIFAMPYINSEKEAWRDAPKLPNL